MQIQQPECEAGLVLPVLLHPLVENALHIRVKRRSLARFGDRAAMAIQSGNNVL